MNRNTLRRKLSFDMEPLEMISVVQVLCMILCTSSDKPTPMLGRNEMRTKELCDAVFAWFYLRFGSLRLLCDYHKCCNISSVNRDRILEETNPTLQNSPDCHHVALFKVGIPSGVAKADFHG